MNRKQFMGAAVAGAAGAAGAALGLRTTSARAAVTGPPTLGTFGFVTDPHIGGGSGYRVGVWKADAYRAEMRFRYFCGGDVVERGDSASNWAAAKAWRDEVSSKTGFNNTLDGSAGNHDERGVGAAEYAANWCEPDGSKVLAADGLSYRVVWASPSSIPPADGYSHCNYDDKLAWLDSALGARRDLHTFLILHAPLAGTIPPDSQGLWSANPGMVAQPADEIDALLAEHKHVGGVLGGHQHPGRSQRWFGWKQVAAGVWVPWIVAPALLNQLDPTVSDTRNSTRVDGLYVHVRPWGFRLWRRRHYDHAWDLLQEIGWRRDP